MKGPDFRRVFKEGRRFFAPHFVLYVCKNGLADARIGISISKAHFKLATRRNKLRRVAKECFRQGIKSRYNGYDFVVASKRACDSANLKDALKEIRSLVSGK